MDLSIYKFRNAAISLGFIIQLYACGPAQKNNSESEQQVAPTRNDKAEILKTEKDLLPVSSYVKAQSAKLLGGTLIITAEKAFQCENRENNVPEILNYVRQKILETCNKSSPGDCGARNACFDKAILETLSTSFTVEFKFTQSGSTDRLFSQPASGQAALSDGSAISINFRWEVGDTKSSTATVSCVEPMKTLFGTKFAENLIPKLTSQISSSGLSCSDIAPSRFSNTSFINGGNSFK